MHDNETMTPRERVETTLALKEPDRVPFAPAFHCAPALLTGMTIEEYFFNISKSYKAVKQVWEMFGGFDMYSGCSPLLVHYLPIPDSHSLFYFDWDLPKGNIPAQMHEREIMKRQDYDRVIEEGFRTFRRFSKELRTQEMNYLAEYAKLDTDSWLAKMDVLALSHSFVCAPVDMLSFLRSFDRFLIDLYKIPDKVIAACESTVAEALRPLDKQLTFMTKQKVPKFVLVGFSRIANDFVSPKRFELFWPHIREIANYIISKDCIVQFHLDNNYSEVLEYFTEFPKGKTMFHLDTTDIFKAKDILGNEACIMGNIPPQLTALGTPREVKKYCETQIAGCMEGGGYILCSSCVLPDIIPASNLKALKDSVMKYGFYRS